MHRDYILRTGRKRNSMAPREPTGRTSRAADEREFPPAQVKRLRDAAMRGLRAPEWGTELGLLYLNNDITAAMYAAGKRWSEMVETYRHAIGVFPVRSVGIERGRGGSSPDPDSPEGRKIAQRESDAAERFFAADAALMQLGGRNPYHFVRMLCEANEMPGGYAELRQLRKGLLVLVAHWDLTGTGKQSNGRNAR
jgi:hypothetical protein